MPTIAEILENTQNSIKESHELLYARHESKASIQSQIDATRKALNESLILLQSAGREVALSPK